MLYLEVRDVLLQVFRTVLKLVHLGKNVDGSFHDSAGALCNADGAKGLLFGGLVLSSGEGYNDTNTPEREGGDTMLTNATEELVREVLTEYKRKDPICDCPNCEDDIVAMVLNVMAPKYFLSNASSAEKIAYVLDKKLRFEALIKISEMVPLVHKQNH